MKSGLNCHHKWKILNLRFRKAVIVQLGSWLLQIVRKHEGARITWDIHAMITWDMMLRNYIKQ